MKVHSIKNAASFAFVLTSLAVATTVQAGDIKPLHSCARSGQAAISAATRVHTATCPAGTKYYEAKVRDEAGVVKPKLSVTVTGSGGTTSPVAGSASTFDNFVSGAFDYGDAGSPIGACDDPGSAQSATGGGANTNASNSRFSGYSRYTLTTAAAAPVNFTVTVTKAAASQNTNTADDSTGTEVYRISDHCVGDATSPYIGPFTSDLGSATSFTNYTNP